MRDTPREWRGGYGFFAATTSTFHGTSVPSSGSGAHGRARVSSSSNASIERCAAGKAETNAASGRLRQDLGGPVAVFASKAGRAHTPRLVPQPRRQPRGHRRDRQRNTPLPGPHGHRQRTRTHLGQAEAGLPRVRRLRDQDRSRDPRRRPRAGLRATTRPQHDPPALAAPEPGNTARDERSPPTSRSKRSPETRPPRSTRQVVAPATNERHDRMPHSAVRHRATRCRSAALQPARTRSFCRVVRYARPDARISVPILSGREYQSQGPALLPPVLLPFQADIDFALDEAPFVRRSQYGDQFVEPSLVGRRKLEPRQEIERLAEVPAVVQAAGHGRKVLQARRDVPGLLLEDRPPLVL